MRCMHCIPCCMNASPLFLLVVLVRKRTWFDTRLTSNTGEACTVVEGPGKKCWATCTMHGAYNRRVPKAGMMLR